MDNDSICRLREALAGAHSVCIFTGAGVSCPSGIPDFRSADGLYNDRTNTRYTPEQMVSHTFLEKYPDLFFDFYKSKMVYPYAVPNAAHRWFASLEREDRSVTVVTQNIDGLHSAAGSSHVLELHGSVHRNYCVSCGRKYDLDTVLAFPGVPHCPAYGGVIRPDVVLYEEALDSATVNAAVAAIADADVMIVAGTSLSVYPAASFVSYFGGRMLALVNKSATPLDNDADVVFNCDIVDFVKEIGDGA